MAFSFFYVKMPGPTAGLVGTLRDIDGLEEFKLMTVLGMKMTAFLGLSPRELSLLAVPTAHKAGSVLSSYTPSPVEWLVFASLRNLRTEVWIRPESASSWMQRALGPFYTNVSYSREIPAWGLGLRSLQVTEWCVSSTVLS